MKKRKKMIKYSKYDEIFSCYCGVPVHIRYDFGNPVSREHFEYARKEYKYEENEVYGKSPRMEALEDIKILDTIKFLESVKKCAQKNPSILDTLDRKKVNQYLKKLREGEKK